MYKMLFFQLVNLLNFSVSKLRPFHYEPNQILSISTFIFLTDNCSPPPPRTQLLIKYEICIFIAGHHLCQGAFVNKQYSFHSKLQVVLAFLSTQFLLCIQTYCISKCIAKAMCGITAFDETAYNLRPKKYCEKSMSISQLIMLYCFR